MEHKSRSTIFLILQRAKVCFILFNPASEELQEKQGNFHQKYLCFSSEERWPRQSPIMLSWGEQDFYFWQYFLFENDGPLEYSGTLKLESFLLPTCFALNRTSYISYFPLKNWEILPSFCWLNSLTKVPGDQFLGGKKKKERILWLKQESSPVPIQNKQHISLQTSIIILIYVSHFVYFAILEKKKKDWRAYEELREIWASPRKQRFGDGVTTARLQREFGKLC